MCFLELVAFAQWSTACLLLFLGCRFLPVLLAFAGRTWENGGAGTLA